MPKTRSYREAASEEAGIRSSQAYTRKHGVEVEVTRRQCKKCWGWTEGDSVSLCGFCGHDDLHEPVVLTEFRCGPFFSTAARGFKFRDVLPTSGRPAPASPPPGAGAALLSDPQEPGTPEGKAYDRKLLGELRERLGV